MIIDLINN